MHCYHRGFFRRASVLTFAVLVLMGNIALAQASPRDVMQLTLDELVHVVETLPGDKNVTERRAELRRIIEPKFDFKEMSKRSLGANWKKQTEEDQNEFVRVFSDLLAKTYLSRIENVESGMVKVKNEKIKGSKALVKTMVTYKGETFPLDYKLLDREGNWQVYDVIIENIGLVANYRNEFAGIIRKEEFSGLLRRLKKKVGEEDEG